MNRFFLLGLCFLMGCSSTGAIYKNYKHLVHLQDGVSEQEAKIIAQRMLVDTDDKDNYRITDPDIKNGPAARKYPGYWFVVFGHNWLAPLSTKADGETYTELREAEYLVVINKKNGRMPFFGEWFPKRENDFDWVFHPDAYHQKDPLALPPGRQSRELF